MKTAATPPVGWTVVVILLLCAIAQAAAVPVLSTSTRATSTSDVIGDYRLSPAFSSLFRTDGCPRSLSATAFYFDQRAAPSSFPAPRRFNIFINHAVTTANNRSCESSGTIYAVQKTHPYVSADPAAVVDSWARGGESDPAPLSKLAAAPLLAAMNRLPWVFGYDFGMRSCRGTTIRSGTAYMWFQPTANVVLAETPRRVILKGGSKYLLLTHRGRPNFACVYSALAVGGDSGWSPGPTSDPSVSKATNATSPTTPVTQAPDGSAPSAPASEERAKEEPLSGTTGGTPDRAEPGTSAPVSPVTPQEGPVIPATEELTGPIDPDCVFCGNDTASPPSTAPRACFPGSATVELESGAHLAMRQLQPGHRIRVSSDMHSDVFIFSHRLGDETKQEFVNIHTDSDHHLMLSPAHYLYADNALVAAKQARQGMTVRLGDGRRARITAVSRVWDTGLYAPHTLHGDLVVNGIVVSSYTMAVHPFVAHHLLLAPLRWLYRTGLPVPRMLEDGSPMLARFAPAGPIRMGSVV